MDVTIYPIDLTGTYYVKPLPIVTSDWGADAVAVSASGATITDPADAYWMFEQAGGDPASTDEQVAVLSTLVAKIKAKTDNLPDEPASKGDVNDALNATPTGTAQSGSVNKILANVEQKGSPYKYTNTDTNETVTVKREDVT